MMKKLILFLALMLFIRTVKAQQITYTFPTPKDWNTEKIALPIDFAPAIPIKGMEELRFTPGWGDSKSSEYWSYAFLWFVDGQQHYKKDTLESYLTQYFNGLYISNLKNKTNAPANFTSVKMKKDKALITDQQTFEGKLTTLNFLTGKPITFYARIHVRNYPASGHTAVLYEISPKDYDNVVWDKLDGVVNGFQVNN
jgi:hypothetical protein